MSDSVFVPLSLLWITQLLWIIYRPKPYMIVTHALLLFILFTVRYTALYFPLVSTIAILLSKQKLGIKLASIGLPLLMIGGFVIFTGGQVEKITGQRHFSPFGGWKVANDALYAYAHVTPEQEGLVPDQFKSLDKIVRQYMVKHGDSTDLLSVDFSSGSYFMFSEESPLLAYAGIRNAENLRFLNTQEWQRVGALYQDYGFYLIREYPDAFLDHFVLPNLFRYVIPPGEILGSHLPFYLHDPDSGRYLQTMLGLRTITPPERNIVFSVRVLKYYPLFFAFVHALFIIGSLGFLFFGGWKKLERPLACCLLVVLCYWLCDLGFSVLSAGIVMRYQVCTMILELAFGIYMLEFIYRVLDGQLDIPSGIEHNPGRIISPR